MFCKAHKLNENKVSRTTVKNKMHASKIPKYKNQLYLYENLKFMKIMVFVEPSNA